MTALLGYQIATVLMMVAVCGYLAYDIVKHKNELRGKDKYLGLTIVSVITEFFDFLGVGSYGPQTACYKKFKLVDDIMIPGTLNTCALTVTGVGTLLFINTIEMDIMTLIAMVIASCIGSFFGSKFVCKLNVTGIRYGMGIALIIVAIVITSGQLGLLPNEGGTAIGLYGWKLVIACVICAVLGALMCLGIGCYAPMLAMICIMGVNPVIAYPVMYGTCMFLIPVAAFRFIKEGKYSKKQAVICNTLGLIGTFTAFYVITSVPIYWLKWFVVAVLIYTSYTMLRDANKNKGVVPGEAKCACGVETDTQTSP